MRPWSEESDSCTRPTQKQPRGPFAAPASLTRVSMPPILPFPVIPQCSLSPCSPLHASPTQTLDVSCPRRLCSLVGSSPTPTPPPRDQAPIACRSGFPCSHQPCCISAAPVTARPCRGVVTRRAAAAPALSCPSGGGEGRALRNSTAWRGEPERLEVL